MSRIAPDGQLEFVRNTETGRVHVLPWMQGDVVTEYVPHEVADTEKFVEALFERTRMLCGVALMIGPGDDWPAVHVGGDAFADDDLLCIACVRALGEDSWLAFHCDNRSAS